MEMGTGTHLKITRMTTILLCHQLRTSPLTAPSDSRDREGLVRQLNKVCLFALERIFETFIRSYLKKISRKRGVKLSLHAFVPFLRIPFMKNGIVPQKLLFNSLI